MLVKREKLKMVGGRSERGGKRCSEGEVLARKNPSSADLVRVSVL